MTGTLALTDFERRLVAVRGIAAAEEAWEKYRAEDLPAGLDPKDEAKMHQAFSAGYDAAMKATRETLVRAQNTALGTDARMAT